MFVYIVVNVHRIGVGCLVLYIYIWFLREPNHLLNQQLLRAQAIVQFLAMTSVPDQTHTELDIVPHTNTRTGWCSAYQDVIRL